MQARNGVDIRWEVASSALWLSARLQCYGQYLGHQLPCYCMVQAQQEDYCRGEGDSAKGSKGRGGRGGEEKEQLHFNVD